MHQQKIMMIYQTILVYHENVQVFEAKLVKIFNCENEMSTLIFCKHNLQYTTTNTFHKGVRIKHIQVNINFPL